MPSTVLTPTHAGNWKPGQSGNPKGRPVGTRGKLANSFIDKLAEDFEIHGVEAIQRVRQTEPDKYLALIAKMIPRQIETPDGENPFTVLLKRMSS